MKNAHSDSSNAESLESHLTLTQRAISAVRMAVLHHGAKEALRIANHLILARLLSPEIFGLMAIVNSCITGLELFSDLGIRQKVIQSSRGTELIFVNTAWTLKVARGVVLWLGTLALAWPLSYYYGGPELWYILPVVGLTAILSGLESMSLVLRDRRLAPGRMFLLDLASQVTSIAVMIIWALVASSIWVLAGGALVYRAVMLVGSHALFPEIRNRFHWSRDCAIELLRFGRWMVPAAVAFFILNHGNRLILGKFVTLSDLGLFSIALFIGNFAVELVRSVASRVLLPLFAQMGTEAAELSKRVARVRGIVLTLSLPPVCIIATWSPEIVALLYDNRYANAGWMVQSLALGSLLGCINACAAPLLLVLGDSRRHFVSLAGALGIFLVFLALGYLMFGWHGIVLAIAAVSVAQYPTLAWALHQHGLWHPRVDFLAGSGAVALVAVLQLVKLGLK